MDRSRKGKEVKKKGEGWSREGEEKDGAVKEGWMDGGIESKGSVAVAVALCRCLPLAFRAYRPCLPYP